MKVLTVEDDNEDEIDEYFVICTENIKSYPDWISNLVDSREIKSSSLEDVQHYINTNQDAVFVEIKHDALVDDNGNVYFPVIKYNKNLLEEE